MMGRRTGAHPTGASRRLPRIAAVSAGVAVLLVSVAVATSGLFGGPVGPANGTARHAPSAGHLEIRLSADGPRVSEMVATVRRHARRTPEAHPDAPVHVVLTSDLIAQSGHDHPMLAGVQFGNTAFVRTDVAWAERTLVHEVAHVLTPGDEHGPIWRTVYLGAIEELFGEARRAREERRAAWVHDRCYRTQECPVRAGGDG